MREKSVRVNTKEKKSCAKIILPIQFISDLREIKKNEVVVIHNDAEFDKYIDLCHNLIKENYNQRNKRITVEFSQRYERQIDKRLESLIKKRF